MSMSICNAPERIENPNTQADRIANPVEQVVANPTERGIIFAVPLWAAFLFSSILFLGFSV